MEVKHMCGVSFKILIDITLLYILLFIIRVVFLVSEPNNNNYKNSNKPSNQTMVLIFNISLNEASDIVNHKGRLISLRGLQRCFALPLPSRERGFL